MCIRDSISELDRLSANEVNDAKRLLLCHLHVVPIGRHPDRIGLLTFDDQPAPRGFELPFVSAPFCQNLSAACRNSGREKNLVTAFVPKPVIRDTHDDVWETVGHLCLGAVDENLIKLVGRSAAPLL